MTSSREYANKLRELADWLDKRPEFPMNDGERPFVHLNYYDREGFTAAVRATKPGKKELTNGSYPEVKFRPSLPNDTYLEIAIARDKVCRKVQEVKWECEPILSELDDQELAEASNG